MIDKAYLLDFKESGEIGPMRIVSMNLAVEEKDLQELHQWLTMKLLVNQRALTMNECDPVSEEQETTERANPPMVPENDGPWQNERVIAEL